MLLGGLHGLPPDKEVLACLVLFGAAIRPVEEHRPIKALVDLLHYETVAVLTEMHVSVIDVGL